MSELLSSLKADLLDRRMLPLLGLLGVALVAAIAYAVLGGGESSASGPQPTASVASSAPESGPSLPVSAAPADPHAAVSETTEGVHYQHKSGARSPFTPLQSASKTSTGSAQTSISGSSTGSPSTGASSGSSGSGSSGSGSAGAGAGAGAGSGSSGGAPAVEPPTEPAPAKKPHKSKVVYVVDVLYGTVPGANQSGPSQLAPYQDLGRLQPLPSAADPRVVYAGVDAAGKAAVFTLAGEAILSGEGTCVPRPTQCEAIALAKGQSEKFGYLEENGQSVVYELKVVSIAKHSASGAGASRANRLDRAGEALIRKLSPTFMRDLRFSSARGVLVYVPRHHRRHRHR